MYLPQAIETFIVRTEVNTVIKNAYTVERNPASQYAIMTKITGSRINPGNWNQFQLTQKMCVGWFNEPLQ